MKQQLWKLLLISCVLLFSAQVFAQESTAAKGARALIDQIHQLAAEKTGKVTDSPTAWREDVEKFRSTASGLNSKMASEQWLALYDRLWQLSPNNQQTRAADALSYYELKISELVAVIPGPESWPFLYQQAHERSDQTKIENLTLQWLTSFLMKNDKEMSAVLKSLDQVAMRLPTWQQEQVKRLVKELTLSLELVFGSSTPEAVINSFLAKVSDKNNNYSTIDIPDVVTLVGSQKAAKIIQQAFEQNNSSYQVPVGDQTRQLAIKTALSMVEQLKTPQWILISESYSSDAIALYEAMAKKFPIPSDNAQIDQITKNSKPRADFSYFLALIMANRTKEAKQLAAKLQSVPGFSFSVRDFTAFMNETGHLPQLYNFFHALLQENPQLELWDYFIPVSAAVGKTDETIVLLQKALESKNLSEIESLKFRGYLFKAFLALDQIEEADKILKSFHFAINPSWTEEQKSKYTEILSNIGNKAIAAGKLLENKDWIEQGLVAVRLVTAQRNDENAVSALLDLKHYDEAEAIIQESILKTIKPQNDGLINIWALSASAQLLVKIYHETGRLEDIIILLQEFPYWEGTSLDDITRFSETGYFAADAYYRRGDLKTAAALAKSIIVKNVGFDPAYELLVTENC